MLECLSNVILMTFTMNLQTGRFCKENKNDKKNGIWMKKKWMFVWVLLFIVRQRITL